MSIASLDNENMWFGETIPSLSQLLTNTIVAAIFNLHDNDVEKMYCFITFLGSETLWFGEIN